MLSDHFRIHYRYPLRTPVQLLIDGNHLLIDCCFRYNHRALRIDPETGECPADNIESGIRSLWSGSYDLGLAELTQPIQVTVAIHRDQRRRSVPICIRHLLLMPAHVISPIYRRLWGIFKTGQLESMGTNWSVQQPGAMILPIDSQTWRLERVAAHEAGHLFGIGDAYAAIYRFYDAVPGAERYMMYANDTVQPAEILMLLQAHQTGRMQYFPRHWQFSRFIRGLRCDVVQRYCQLQQYWAEWRKQ